MTSIRIDLSPPEAVERFREQTLVLLREGQGKLSSDQRQRLTDLARELGVHPLDRDAVQAEVAALPEMQALRNRLDKYTVMEYRLAAAWGDKDAQATLNRLKLGMATPEEAVELFRCTVCALELTICSLLSQKKWIKGDFSSELHHKLEAKAREWGVHPMDRDAILAKVEVGLELGVQSWFEEAGFREEDTIPLTLLPEELAWYDYIERLRQEQEGKRHNEAQESPRPTSSADPRKSAFINRFIYNDDSTVTDTQTGESFGERTSGYVRDFIVRFLHGGSRDERRQTPGWNTRPLPKGEQYIGVANRFIDHGDGAVTDRHTGLMWKRCSEGQTWAGGTCSGEAALINIGDLDPRTWPSFAGHDDWRLPTTEELQTLVSCGNGATASKAWGCKGFRLYPWRREAQPSQSPTIDQVVFPSTPPASYWSSTISVDRIAVCGWAILLVCLLPEAEIGHRLPIFLPLSIAAVVFMFIKLSCLNDYGKNGWLTLIGFRRIVNFYHGFSDTDSSLTFLRERFHRRQISQDICDAYVRLVRKAENNGNRKRGI